MGRQIKTKAIVLHEMPIGDYDKRLILLTKEQGKVTAFIKGVRRPNNKMLAASQLFTYGEYVLGQGKTNYTVYQAELIEPFHQIRMDMFDLTYGMYMLEFTAHVARDEEENQALLHWLLLSLKVMDQKHMATRLVIRIFELKAMSLLGFTPWLNDCVVCHREGPLYFSPELGGVVCKDSSHGVHDLIRLHSGTLHAMRFILTQPIKTIYSFELDEQGLLELEQLMTQFVRHNLDKKFKTMEFLRGL